MGIFVKSTEEKKVNIKGTPIELESVYLRVEFASRADGQTMEIANYSYYDKQGFKDNVIVPTDLPEGSLTVKIEAGTEQTSEVALAYMAEALKQQGYEVEIEKI